MNSQEILIQAWSTEIFHQSENVKSSPNFGVDPLCCDYEKCVL